MGHEVLGVDESLWARITAALNDPRSVKVVAASDGEGCPWPAVKASLHSEGGNLVYSEYLESSKTNRYMTRSLWFNKTVRVLVTTSGGESFVVTALPVRAIVNGKDFQRYYESAKEAGLDLAAVWILKPLEAACETLKTRVDEEAAARPYFAHLDRLARKEGLNDGKTQ